MSRNSMTPSRALRTIGERVLKTLGEPSLFGIKSFTPMAHDACGFGMPTTSIRHIRQLPAIDSRSWKQKRGISAPAASQAWSSVYSGGTSISLPSTMSLVMQISQHTSLFQGVFPRRSVSYVEHTDTPNIFLSLWSNQRTSSDMRSAVSSHPEAQRSKVLQ